MMLLFFKPPSKIPSKITCTYKPLPPTNIILLQILAGPQILGKKVGRYLAKDSKLKLYVDGNRVKALGVKTPSRIKIILERILFAKMDGQIRSGREEINEARRLISFQGE